MIDRRGQIEVRTNDDGSLDEIVMYDAAGTCIFHLEQMNDQCYWLRFYGDPSKWELVCNVFVRGNRDIEAKYEWERS